MKTYYVIWTYVANYGKLDVQAENPKAAAEKVALGFSADFQARGKVYVFENYPAYVWNQGIKDER